MAAWSQCSLQISSTTHLWPAVQRCWKARDTRVLLLTAFWMLALLPSARVASPSHTRSRLLQKRITVLAALLPYSSECTCTESTTCLLLLLLLVLENCTLCVQCHVCSRSTQGSVCERVHHHNHVCVQTTADLLLLDGCSPVHCYRKQETEVQF